MTEQIINVFGEYKMLPLNADVDQFESKGRSVMEEKINSFISKKQPISFVMLGYPFKSTNTLTKVLGDVPDMNEIISIKRIEEFTEKIKNIYSHGAHITVASDGYLFNDLLDVDEKIVRQYREMCESYSVTGGFQLIDLYDFYKSNGREKVMNDFGITDTEMEKRILFDININWLYRGMTRFMEEELMMKEFPSRNQRHVAAKRLTKNMMLRNEAYSQLVSHEFSESIRLSMHQTINDGRKFSFDLIKGARHSPWHSVLVKDGDLTLTMHKKDAIERGYILNNNHFIRP